MLFAMKIIKKASEEENNYIRNEANLHRGLNHEFIIKFIEFFETETHFYIILEYAQKGDLFELIYQ